MDLFEQLRAGLSKPYDPHEVEKFVYEWWETNGYFRPEKQRELGLVTDASPRYCLTNPPPNVTGVLHLGHAITLSIEDLMVRVARMQQKETLYVPGCDHAGIATQNVVERELNKKKMSRKTLGREKFIEKVWEWKHQYHARITEQSKSLGLSADWTREKFTLDENLSKAVRTAFVHLYKKGLIYRGTYMVNWCPGRCESAISDLEAVSEEVPSNLWYIKYPIATENWSGPKAEWGSGKWAEGATEFIIVATTRPETLLGDTGVATFDKHPEFAKFIGKDVILPVNANKIPVFHDKYVDMSFGTGAVKITPAHDPNDYEIGKEHNLGFIEVIDSKGKMTSEYSAKYQGMDRFECRKEIVKDLEKEGLLVKIEPYTHAVAHCQRCNTVIEPKVSTQWFVSTKQLANNAMDAVRSGQTVMIPEKEEQRFYNWMENIRDWCISRQLWWGHRIPVWYCSNGHEVCEMEDPTECPKCHDKNLKQDEDVLDTWFSSGLWAFSTLGWPNTDHPDFKRFYPTDMRETGYDILFFWVAREMMLGCELTHQSPFKTCYFHGMVRNEEGKKISKSMENIAQYDPLNIIAKYGADALRYTLVAGVIPSRDVNLDLRNVDAARKFCNKIWQSSKYILSHIAPEENLPQLNGRYPKKKLLKADKWILSRLHRLIQQINVNMEKYVFMDIARDLQKFYWEEFCDWYLEITKIRLYGDESADKVTPKVILLTVLETIMRLMHPIMPYITETIWQFLPATFKTGNALIVAPWPSADSAYIDNAIEDEFGTVIDLIHAIRHERTDFGLNPGQKIHVMIDSGGKSALVKGSADIICTLANVDPQKLEIDFGTEIPKHAARANVRGMSAYLPLEGLIDLEAEKQKRLKDLAQLDTQIQKIKGLLNSQFAQKADPKVVEEKREKLKEWEEKKILLQIQIDVL
jgi:valyl-tRNA synthetase